LSLVIDSSITLAWFFEDERSDRADTLMRQVASAGAVVPSLWRLEIPNALQSAVRRKRISAEFRVLSARALRCGVSGTRPALAVAIGHAR